MNEQTKLAYLWGDETEQCERVGGLSEIEKISSNENLRHVDGSHRQPLSLLHSEGDWKGLQSQRSAKRRKNGNEDIVIFSANSNYF